MTIEKGDVVYSRDGTVWMVASVYVVGGKNFYSLRRRSPHGLQTWNVQDREITLVDAEQRKQIQQRAMQDAARAHWAKVDALREDPEPAEPIMTDAELRKLIKDPRYWLQRDPDVVKQVTEGYNALYGSKKGE